MKPRNPLTFFIDRSLGRHTIADALRKVGARVEIHDDHFPSDATDDQWLTEVGKLGWVVLTKDKRIRRRSLELIAVQSAGVRMFQLTGGNLEGREMADAFAQALPRMERFTLGNPGPFIASVSPSGRVKMMLTRTQLKRIAR